MYEEIPRGVEVLVKKAAVDPAFKKTLLKKRARAADDISLKLEAAEVAMLNAAPVKHIEAIVANTKVKPSLRPAFLGYAAAAMLAAVGATTITRAQGRAGEATYGITPGNLPPPDRGSRTPPGSPEDWDLEAEYSTIVGRVLDSNNRPINGAEVTIFTMEGEISGLTDRKGAYLIEKVRLGCWPVKASRAGYETQTQEDIFVLKGLKTNLTFILLKKGTSSSNRTSGESSIDGIRPDKP